MEHCRNCNSELQAGWKFCVMCGERSEPTSRSELAIFATSKTGRIVVPMALILMGAIVAAAATLAVATVSLVTL